MTLLAQYEPNTARARPTPPNCKHFCDWVPASRSAGVDAVGLHPATELGVDDAQCPAAVWGPVYGHVWCPALCRDPTAVPVLTPPCNAVSVCAVSKQLSASLDTRVCVSVSLLQQYVST